MAQFSGLGHFLIPSFDPDCGSHDHFSEAKIREQPRPLPRSLPPRLTCNGILLASQQAWDLQLSEAQIFFSERNKKDTAIKDKMLAYIDELNSYSEKYYDIDQEVKNRVNYILPDNYEPEILLMQFEELSLKRGLMLASIKINKSGEGTISTKSNSKKKGSASTKSVGNLPPEIGAVSISASFLGTDYDGLKKLLIFAKLQCACF